VFLMLGSGQIVVNHVDFQDYFRNKTQRVVATQPLDLTANRDKFDIYVNVGGGGYAGQAGAVRHGIARALLEFDPDLRPSLKKAGFLTRDPRQKERKKYGQPGARKRYQFSKR
jgi:small subunit ribosomal protein S9